MRLSTLQILTAAFTLACIVIGAALFAIRHARLFPKPHDESVLCGTRGFDYVRMLDAIKQEREFDAGRLKALEASPDEKARAERLAWLHDKERALETLAKLIDAQGRVAASAVGCFDQTSEDILVEADFPTQSDLEKKRIIEMTSKRFDEWKAKSEDAQVIPWLALGIGAVGTLGGLGLSIVQFKKQRDDKAEADAAKKQKPRPPPPPA
jgi:hypothetical protein